jgi:hypothetical protein
MIRRNAHYVLLSWIALCTVVATAPADEFCLDCTRPTCGKVCRLVCEKKKLTANCYACECKQICIPDPSREGCKHCAVCYGECPAPSCDPCQAHTPKCEFCWKDWFACGCAQPRTVKVLTKYQAEREIGWYHWEVVDAACCDAVSKNGSAPASGNGTVAKSAGARAFYKPAPSDAALGDVLAVSDEEWVKLAPVLIPEGTDQPGQVATISPAAPTAAQDPSQSAPPRTPSLAERFDRLFRK